MTDCEKYCAVCGKMFIPYDIEHYVYKKCEYHKKEGFSVMRYFCSWTCLRKYEKEMEEKKKDDNKLHCSDCRYFMRAGHGFYDCSVNAFSVDPMKCACTKFKINQEKA